MDLKISYPAGSNGDIINFVLRSSKQHPKKGDIIFIGDHWIVTGAISEGTKCIGSCYRKCMSDSNKQ